MGNTSNIIVGAGVAFIKSAVVLTATSAATASNSTTYTVLNPTTDAAKFSLGDIITIGTNTEKVQITAIDPTLGKLTHEAVTTVANAVTVTQLWRNLGYTDGGVELSGSLSTQDHFVDQEADPVKTTLDKRETGLKIPMAEMTLQNLALALGAPTTAISTDSGVEILGIGSTSGVREDTFLVTGNAPNGKKRTIQIHRGVNKGALSYKMDSKNKAIAALDLKALFDSSKPVGQQLMTIKDHATVYQY